MRRFVWSLVLSGLLARAGGQAVTPNVERARNILKEGIENKDPDVRIQAIVAGSMIGRHEAVVKRLVAALQDKDVQVRITTIRALQDMNSPDTLPALEKTPQRRWRSGGKVCCGEGSVRIAGPGWKEGSHGRL
jgi:hypothetical protein